MTTYDDGGGAFIHGKVKEAEPKPLKALAVVPRNMEQVILDVVAERARQTEKWGDQSSRPPADWIVILAEEFGEAAKEVCEMGLGRVVGVSTLSATVAFVQSLCDSERWGGHAPLLRKELVQVAAVAVAMIEAGDKRCWWPMTGEEQCTTES